MEEKPRILVVEARFYAAMADALMAGAGAVLEGQAKFESLSVPGVLEIPPAIAMAANSGEFDGYLALGVVIRGETSHYDIVSETSAQGLMWLGTKRGLAIGNGIQTTENEMQAWARVRAREKDKGGGAAQALLSLLAVRRRFLSVAQIF